MVREGFHFLEWGYYLRPADRAHELKDLLSSMLHDVACGLWVWQLVLAERALQSMSPLLGIAGR